MPRPSPVQGVTDTSMSMRQSSYTRTERLCLAFRLLLEEQGCLSPVSLSLATGAPVKTCRADLALLRRFVSLARVGSGPETCWALPDRAPEPRNQVAYELYASGMAWDAVARELGYSRATQARDAARRYAAREAKWWPPRNAARPSRR
jgi:hypothetical protein